MENEVGAGFISPPRNAEAVVPCCVMPGNASALDLGSPNPPSRRAYGSPAGLGCAGWWGIALQHLPSPMEAACILEGKARVSSGLLCTDWAGAVRPRLVEGEAEHCSTALTLVADFCISLLLIPKRCWWNEILKQRQPRFGVGHPRSWDGRAGVEPHAPLLANRPVAFRIFFFLEPGTVPAPRQEPAGLHSAG